MCTRIQISHIYFHVFFFLHFHTYTCVKVDKVVMYFIALLQPKMIKKLKFEMFLCILVYLHTYRVHILHIHKIFGTYLNTGDAYFVN